MKEVKSDRLDRNQLKAELGRVAQTNLLDRVISYIDPVRGAQRMRARMISAVAGGYIGGSRKRRATSEWNVSRSARADADLNPDLQDLRDRSRDLVRNAPIAGGAVNTTVTHVVGTGLMLQSRINRGLLKMSADEAAAWQDRAELEFQLWAGNADCDITRGQCFYELQDLVFRATLESGDAFVLMPNLKRPGNPYGLKIQVIEADRVANPKGEMDKPTLSAGVKMEETGAPIGYHIYRQHPGSLMRNSFEADYYPAFGEKTGRRNVLHIYKRLRPGQTRGEPFLAPVIEPLKQLDRYTEAEIMAAVVSAMFTVFTHSEGGTGLDPAMPNTLGGETGAQSSDADVKLGNGAIVDLGKDEKIEIANPGRPNAAFDPFVLAILRQIGMRLGMPYEVLIMHFTASYSAARAALLTAWRFWNAKRAWLAGAFCQPVYETFLAEAIAMGRLTAPGFFDDPLMRMAYCGAEWVGDGMGSINPKDEVDAADTRIKIGLTTLQKETALYDGGDWEANHEQRKIEAARRRADGLDIEPIAERIRTEPTKPTSGAEPGKGGSDLENA